jgi:hypothetical protein
LLMNFLPTFLRLLLLITSFVCADLIDADALWYCSLPRFDSVSQVSFSGPTVQYSIAAVRFVGQRGVSLKVVNKSLRTKLVEIVCEDTVEYIEYIETGKQESTKKSKRTTTSD